MKDGKIRIISGIVLIVAQLISLIGNSNNGIMVSFANNIYDCVAFVSYFFYGILGIVLVISGCRAFKVPKEVMGDNIDADNEYFNKYRVFCIVLSIMSIVFKLLECYYFSIFGVNILTLLLLCIIDITIISSIYINVYFIKYMGRKKSVLLSSAIIIFAINLIVNIISNLDNIFAEVDIYLILQNIFKFASAILLFTIGVKLYKGVSKTNLIRICKVAVLLMILASLVLPTISVVRDGVVNIYYIKFAEVCFSLSVGVYICKIPIYTGEDFDKVLSM